ncbi:hypothetical protein ACFY7H_22050 [Streptomyces sp. NPDC012794]|uniref:hypothetical protein n=1 Tax=Streptomyces sp. NPDC012794 TaxID=3364850 RepID=UPI00369393FF
MTGPFADLVGQLPVRAAVVAGPSGGEQPQLPRGPIQSEAEPGRQRALGLTEVRQCLDGPLSVLGDRPVEEDAGRWNFVYRSGAVLAAARRSRSVWRAVRA